jgi:deazaflavin-dependent oxidoreductase (nitroreductase family)
MPDPNATAWEDRLIEEMRANGGEVKNGPLAGHPLLIMTSRGAKSRESRRAILTYHKDGTDFVVAGTASGSPKTPGWVYNVEADPNVTIEVGNEEVGATASVVDDGSERDRLWNDHVERLPWFAEYPKQTGRVIPMVRLTPKAA